MQSLGGDAVAASRELLMFLKTAEKLYEINIVS